MTLVMGGRIGIFGQRSFWLRCFLGNAIWLIAAALVGGTPSNAMTCISQRTIGVSHLDGRVFDPAGVLVPEVRITITQGEQQIAGGMTNSEGEFKFDVPSGEYQIFAQHDGFMPLNLKVRVGGVSLLPRGSLNLVLGLSGTSCGFGTTSRKEVKQAVENFKSRAGNK